MKTWLCYVVFVVLFLGISEGKAKAQDPLQFPTTRKGISEAFQSRPVQDLGSPKSFSPDKSLPSEIAEDNPRVGALIRFDFDSDAIIPESYPLLREFGASFQKDLPDARFLIEGHADSKGTDAYNMDLSRRRAEAVRQFLMSFFQIDAGRLSIMAHGESRPIASNDTEDGRALNRRVEFVREQ